MARALEKPEPPTGILVGYARVSTADQSLDLQRDALRKAGIAPEHIHEEHASGASRKRPKLDLALKDCRRGDTFVVWKLDRFGRSLLDLLHRMQDLEKRGIGFKSLTEGIDTTTPGGRLIMHVMGALAQFERDLIVERTRAGIAAKRAQGVVFGAKPKIDMVQAAEMIAAGRSVEAVAKRFKCHRSAVYQRFPPNVRFRLRAEREAKLKR